MTGGGGEVGGLVIGVYTSEAGGGKDAQPAAFAQPLLRCGCSAGCIGPHATHKAVRPVWQAGGSGMAVVAGPKCRCSCQCQVCDKHTTTRHTCNTWRCGAGCEAVGSAPTQVCWTGHDRGRAQGPGHVGMGRGGGAGTTCLHAAGSAGGGRLWLLWDGNGQRLACCCWCGKENAAMHLATAPHSAFGNKQPCCQTAWKLCGAV